MALPEIVIGSKFDAKGFKQAETATDKLGKSIKNLAYSFGLVFSAQNVISFGKTAAKAFAADEKAARSLSLALANTGNAFAGIEVEKFIADLQRTTGVLDDNLRPAFRTLLTATGDVRKSQDGLALALDIAAGTGRDLGSVSAALAKGFSGQTTALSRLGAGLDKATLASGDMDLIIAELTKKFKGQALAAAEGYSGQMDRLVVASNNAKEIIGKDLLDAMSMIAGKDGIGGATTAMEDFATQIGNAIYGIGVLTKSINSLPGAGFIGDVLSAGASISGLGLLSRLGASKKPSAGQASPGGAGSAAAQLKYDKEQIKLQKTKNSLSKIDNDNTTRKLALTGDQLALLELEKQFDVERIGLFAALNGNIDSETQMRVLSLIAIKDQNAALAGMIAKANLASDALTAFKDAIVASIKALTDKVQAEIDALNAQFGGSSGGNSGYGFNNPENPGGINPPDYGVINDLNSGQFQIGERNTFNDYMAGLGTTNITINAQGIGDQQIASVVQNAIQNLNRYGNSTTFAGAI
jgi:F0F1-type ATP synthase delta subunit